MTWYTEGRFLPAPTCERNQAPQVDYKRRGETKRECVFHDRGDQRSHIRHPRNGGQITEEQRDLSASDILTLSRWAGLEVKPRSMSYEPPLLVHV
jgi:hypothetical protein